MGAKYDCQECCSTKFESYRPKEGRWVCRQVLVIGRRLCKQGPMKAELVPVPVALQTHYPSSTAQLHHLPR